MELHETYIQRCFELGKQALGLAAPNPMVGCVIVANNAIIAEGYHERYGTPHAEANAINQLADKELLKKATLYVNLEPCAHQGKNPPCADLIIRYGIPKVVIANKDPNPLVNGKGIELLKNKGCEIVTGVLEKEGWELNKRFFTFHEKKRPYIILKWAQTSDGFIDTQRTEKDTGKQEKISNEYSIQLLHRWRSEEQAVMIGTNTALLDNPRLTVRHHTGKNPLRIVVDKWLRIPKSYHLYDGSAPTLLFTSAVKEDTLSISYATIDFEKNIPTQLMTELHHRQIQSVIIEGGELFLNSFISQGLWDEARVIVSPKKLMKGVKAPVLLKQVSAVENIHGDELLIYKNPHPAT